MYNTNVYNKSTMSKIKVKCILWDTMYIIEYNVYNKSTMSIIKSNGYNKSTMSIVKVQFLL